VEKQAAQYVAGYVANRFSHNYPHLISNYVENSISDSWITLNSRGGLKIPSDNLVDAVCVMETHFKNLHGDGLSKISGVMSYLTNVLKPKIGYLNIPDEVLECLVRTRTFIRLNNLNATILYGKKPCKNNKLKKFTS